MTTSPHDPSPPPTTVVFDLGGVLIAWDPALAFADVLEPHEVQPFFDEIGFEEWNLAQDRGRTLAEGVRELGARFPHRAAHIAAYERSWQSSLTGEMPETVTVVDELERAGVRLLALTNWSAETFPWAMQTFPVLRRFEGVVVSGVERLVKPDAAIFELLLDRYGLDAGATVFVDDKPANVEAAVALGLHGLVFTDAPTLRADLQRLGVLDTPPPTSTATAQATDTAQATGTA
ncbi:MAG TPA: HAD family phosphatase [Actinomycetales bacterium]